MKSIIGKILIIAFYFVAIIYIVIKAGEGTVTQELAIALFVALSVLTFEKGVNLFEAIWNYEKD